MQAFIYRHLVPAQELKVTVLGRGLQRGPPKILSATPVKIPLGGTALVKIGAPGVFVDGFELELNEAPEGIQHHAFPGGARLRRARCLHEAATGCTLGRLRIVLELRLDPFRETEWFFPQIQGRPTDSQSIRGTSMKFREDTDFR